VLADDGLDGLGARHRGLAAEQRARRAEPEAGGLGEPGEERGPHAVLRAQRVHHLQVLLLALPHLLRVCQHLPHTYIHSEWEDT
jgi:hypothetical protein